MFNFREYREPDNRLPDFLPWAIAISPTTILQKDGLLLRCWRYRGPDLSVASLHEQASAAAQTNAVLTRLGSGWGLWIEMARRESDEYQESQFPNVASRIVDLEMSSLFKHGRVIHESNYYLSLGWSLPPDHEQAISQSFYGGNEPNSGDNVLALDLEYFDRVCTEITDLLAGVFEEIQPLTSDELLSYLKSCISTQRQQVAMPDTPAYLDAYLPDEPFTAGDVSLLGDQCLAMFTIRGFPAKTPFAMLDELCHLGIAFRWMTRFLPLDYDDAQRVLSRHQRRWFLSRKSVAKHGAEIASGSESKLLNPIADDKANDASAALRALGAGEIAFGYFTSTIVVWDPDPDVARKKALELKKVVQRRKLVAIDETMNSMQAWLGTIPGHVHANPRRPLLHTKNLVRLMPILGMYTGSRENVHLKRITGVGTPHVSCVSGTTRVDINLNVDDVGHTLIIGPTSAGKSTLAAVLALMWPKYPGAKVIIYDVGGSARAATMAAGGAYYAPGDPQMNCGFQPLRDIHKPTERAWATHWVIKLLELRHVRCTHEVELHVHQALEAMASNPDPRSRTMTELASLLGSWQRELGAALRPYTLEGLYGSIFDRDHDPLVDTHWRTYEMKPLLKPEMRDALLPALMYLAHRDEAMIDGSPVLKIKDECWRFWDDAMMLADTRADVKTGRVNCIYNVYLTQEIADVASNPLLMSALLTNCKTHIYLPNAEATAPITAAQYASFGLTPSEISSLTTATRQRHYFFRNALGRRWISLPIGPATLAFVGGASPADHEIMNAIVRERDPREYALALLERRNVTWAIDAAKKLGAQNAA